MDRRLNQLRILLGLITLLVIAITASTRIVSEGEAVIVTRLGAASRTITTPGLHWKLPWPIDDVVAIDMRKRNFRSKHTEMLTKDKKNIVLLSFALWSVRDPLLFYQAVGTLEEGDEKLNGLLTNAKIAILGKYDLRALASDDPETLRVTDIEQAIQTEISTIAAERYGIEVHDIGLGRLSLPQKNVMSVFKQMRAERKQYAAHFKAEGERQATEIRSQTDLDVAKLQAEATEKSAKIKGEAEAEAARIYAGAYGKDPELYRFIRSLETLDDILGTRSTVVLRTDSEPFRLLAEPQ